MCHFRTNSVNSCSSLSNPTSFSKTCAAAAAAAVADAAAETAAADEEEDEGDRVVSILKSGSDNKATNEVMQCLVNLNERRNGGKL